MAVEPKSKLIPRVLGWGPVNSFFVKPKLGIFLKPGPLWRGASRHWESW